MKRKRKLLTHFLVLLLVFAVAKSCEAAIYYVAKNGSDSYTKTQAQNQVTPWLTIRKCAENVAIGDTCEIGSGTYLETERSGSSYQESPLTPAVSGTESQPITFKASAGASVTVRCATRPACGSMYKHWVIYDGLTCDNDGLYNWSVYVHSADHVTLRNCKVKGTATPNGCEQGNGASLRVDNSSYALIQNNDIYNYAGTSGNCNQMTSYNMHNSIIEKNNFRDGFNGIHDKEEAQNNIYRFNKFYNLGGYGFFLSDNSIKTDNVYIYQNIFYNVGTGIHFRGDNPGLTGNLQIYNNIIELSGAPGNAYGPSHYVSQLQMWNNVFYVSGSNYAISLYDGAENGITYCDYNNYYPTARFIEQYGQWNYTTISAWQAAKSWDDHAITTDPLFVDRANHDYHLQAGSPLRTAGRGGAYASFIGAYITGTEQIGYAPTGQTSDTTPPNLPVGLSVH